MNDSVFYCSQCGFAVETIEVTTYTTEAKPLPNQFVIDESEINTENEIISLRKCPKCEAPFLNKNMYI